MDTFIRLAGNNNAEYIRYLTYSIYSIYFGYLRPTTTLPNSLVPVPPCLAALARRLALLLTLHFTLYTHFPPISPHTPLTPPTPPTPTQTGALLLLHRTPYSVLRKLPCRLFWPTWNLVLRWSVQHGCRCFSFTITVSALSLQRSVYESSASSTAFALFRMLVSINVLSATTGQSEHEYNRK